MDEIQETDLPCYECLCLPACKSKPMYVIVNCDYVYNFLRVGDTYLPINSYRLDLLMRYLFKGFI